MLCGFQHKFSWLETNTSRIKLDLIGKQAVIGGHNDDPKVGIVNIGRIYQAGETRIGYVKGEINNEELVYTDNNGLTQLSEYFQILIFNSTGFF